MGVNVELISPTFNRIPRTLPAENIHSPAFPSRKHTRTKTHQMNIVEFLNSARGGAAAVTQRNRLPQVLAPDDAKLYRRSRLP